MSRPVATADYTAPDEALAAAVELHAHLDRIGYAVPCVTHDATDDLWFSPNAAKRERAVALCGTCPVLDLCVRYADLADERIGVWGTDRTGGGGCRVATPPRLVEVSL